MTLFDVFMSFLYLCAVYGLGLATGAFVATVVRKDKGQ